MSEIESLLTAERARELLSYEPETGILRWKVARPNRVHPGDIAGCMTWKGYNQIRIGGHAYFGHRLAWLLTYGEWPIGEIDHIDRNRSNNRITNLRAVSRKENAQNMSSYSPRVRDAAWLAKQRKRYAGILAEIENKAL